MKSLIVLTTAPEKSSAGVRQMRSMQQCWPVLPLKIESAATDGKLQHWRGFPGIYGLGGALVLEFGIVSLWESARQSLNL